MTSGLPDVSSQPRKGVDDPDETPTVTSVLQSLPASTIPALADTLPTTSVAGNSNNNNNGNGHGNGKGEHDSHNNNNNNNSHNKSDKSVSKSSGLNPTAEKLLIAAGSIGRNLYCCLVDVINLTDTVNRVIHTPLLCSLDCLSHGEEVETEEA